MVKIGIEKIDIENIHRRDMMEEICMEKADRDGRKITEQRDLNGLFSKNC